MALLRLNSVSRTYQRGSSIRPVLKDVSLEVGGGQMVGIYGARGSGKTTLLRIAAGFDRPDGGTVSFEGVDLASLDDDQLAQLHREKIAFAEREPPHLEDLSAIDYVAIPLYGRVSPTGARRRAGATLAQFGVGDVRDATWSDISDAGRVLVSLAHALVRQPRLLVIDDLTAYLGAYDRDYVLSLLRSSAENNGIGVLMTTPDTPEILQVEAHLLARGQLVTPGESNVVDISAHSA
jgi:ABC-type lipoprotein export system ATPase subunit